MNRLLSYALLLSFFVLLTPRIVWHDCEHEDHHHEIEQNSETHAEQDNCFVCEFDLGFISQPVIASFYFEGPVYPNQKDSQTFKLFLQSFDSFSRRGPPQA